MSWPLLLQAETTGGVGEAALFLIVGGLFMLGLVVALVVLRSVFPTGKPSSQGLMRDRLDRAMRRTPGIEDFSQRGAPLAVADLDQGRQFAQKLHPKRIDDALDYVERQGWAHPRMLRHMDDKTVVRYIDCKECRQPTDVQQGCGVQAGFLEGALRLLEGPHAKVTETACRRAGAPVCEFEVKH